LLALPNFSGLLNGWSPNEGHAPSAGDRRLLAAHSRWPFLGSLAGHGLLLLAFGLLPSVQPMGTPALQSIDVQIISAPPDFRAQHATPAVGATSPPPMAAPTVAPPAPRKEAPGDGMIHPTQLLTQAYIREPASLEIRKNLPKLAPNERVTQLCNIEAAQQIQAADPKVLVDTVHASALGDTTVDGLTISAPLAAYRSKRQWYAVSFICTVAPNFGSVTKFSFKVGAPIPRGEWEGHYLNLADENE
jgi:hypothetical protein